MEIEAKFRIENPTIFTTLMRLNRLANYRLVSTPHIEQQHNIYYDSADRRLQSALYGLRTREVDGRCVV
ncbi:MAG: CYTH domain-containing protein, partial [Blastochloris sp.]|nr:CYTH domain-containing protein [Blastochloris sp.]